MGRGVTFTVNICIPTVSNDINESKELDKYRIFNKRKMKSRLSETYLLFNGFTASSTLLLFFDFG